jgi:hypothetical protein
VPVGNVGRPCRHRYRRRGLLVSSYALVPSAPPERDGPRWGNRGGPFLCPNSKTEKRQQQKLYDDAPGNHFDCPRRQERAR